MLQRVVNNAINGSKFGVVLKGIDFFIVGINPLRIGFEFFYFFLPHGCFGPLMLRRIAPIFKEIKRIINSPRFLLLEIPGLQLTALPQSPSPFDH